MKKYISCGVFCKSKNDKHKMLIVSIWTRNMVVYYGTGSTYIFDNT